VAGHEAIADQEGDRLGDVLRPPHAADRGLGSVVSKHRPLRLLRKGAPPGRVDHARGDAVHAQRLEFDGEDRDEPHHRRIGGRRRSPADDGVDDWLRSVFLELLGNRLLWTAGGYDATMNARPYGVSEGVDDQLGFATLAVSFSTNVRQPRGHTPHRAWDRRLLSA
jgi:hypothetical protein